MKPMTLLLTVAAATLATLFLTKIVFAADLTATPQPATWNELLFTTAIGVIGFVGSMVVMLRPLILAKVAQAVASVNFDRRDTLERAISAALELHPNSFDEAADYVRATIPDVLKDLGVADDMLPKIIESRKLKLRREDMRSAVA